MSTQAGENIPLLSVCIPTYNRPEILDFGLERLAAVQRAAGGGIGGWRWSYRIMLQPNRRRG